MTGIGFLLFAVLVVAIRIAFVAYKRKQSAKIAEEKRLENERIAEERAQRDKDSQEESRVRLSATIEKVQNIFDRNNNLVQKFLEIAETKVSIIDEYGDESWDALPNEIRSCLKKIANRENCKINWKSFSVDAEKDFDTALRSNDWNRLSWIEMSRWSKDAVDMYLYWLYNKLETTFKEYHAAHKERPTLSNDLLRTLSGVEFETYIARILKQFGFEVSGTPATGDQGADLIATRDGKRIIIQAKRYEGAVGNKAVQEVTGAVSYYGGDEGWVITNSTFTPSAKALAQKANVRLIDGARLAAMEKLIERRNA